MAALIDAEPTRSLTRHAPRSFAAQRENDPESGLMHYRARSYDPRTGRFVQRDPLDSISGADLPKGYSYVGQSPLNAVDPQGLFKVDIHEAITKDAIGAKFGKKLLQADKLDRIITANKDQDLHQLANEFHYDNRDIAAGNAYVESQYLYIRGTGAEKAEDFTDVAKAFGRILHARQDFYAHSTFVEIWLLRATTASAYDIELGRKSLVDAIAANKDALETVPTFSFVQTTETVDGKEQKGFFAYGKELVTGHWVDQPGKVPTHGQLNKDNDSSDRGKLKNALGHSLHKFARKAATQQTTTEWDRLLKEVKQNPAARGWEEFVSPGK